jgi:hypothetical protein
VRLRCATRWLHLSALVLMTILARPAIAQSFEAALSPGNVIEGHAKVEGDCQKCHVRFDRAAQDGLCLDCHKEVGRDFMVV